MMTAAQSEKTRLIIHFLYKTTCRVSEMIGIRLDSGDLVELSIAAREILDEGGFPDATIVASNDLDEHLIRDLKQQGAKINVWGVGTRLATAFDQPALGGVYKLSAIRGDDGEWENKIKLSEQTVKISTPGILQVARYSNADGFLVDCIYDERQGSDSPHLVRLHDQAEIRLPNDAQAEDLLVPVFRGGRQVYEVPDVQQARDRAARQLNLLPAAILRLVNPRPYNVGLDRWLYALRTKMVSEARGTSK